MPSDSRERSQRARIAALARSAQEPSGTAMTAKARQAFLDSFYARTDPELPERERQRQASARYRLHMTRLSHSRRLIRARLQGDMAAAAAIEAELAELGADDGTEADVSGADDGTIAL